MQLGGIRSLIDRRTGAELILPGAAASLLEYSVERPHGMTAWLIDNAGPVERPAVLSVAQRLKGPYRASIDVRCRIRESEFTLTYELRAGDPRLHLQCRGTWFQRGSPEHGVPNLRLALPLALDDARATYEVPFGALERRAKPDEEVPALQWALVRGRIGQRRAGVLLANDSKHGHALAGSTLRLNLVRAGYDPDPLPEIGSHEIGLTLQALPDGGTVPEAVQAGCALNQPLRAVGTGVHAGTWPVAAQLLAVEPAAVRLLCAKQAEDGEALVLRLSNLTGKAVAAKVSLHERLAGRKLRAAALDLMERPVKDASVKAAGRTVSVRVPAWGITTLRLERG
jgi:alpha-mannosidase